MSLTGFVGYIGLIIGGLIGLIIWQRTRSINIGRAISGLWAYILIDCFLMLQWSASGVLYLFLLFFIIFTFQNTARFQSEWLGWLVLAGVSANLVLFQGNIFGNFSLDLTRVLVFYQIMIVFVLVLAIFVLGIPLIVVSLKRKTQKSPQPIIREFFKSRAMKLGILIGLFVVNLILFSLVRLSINLFTETAYQQLIDGLMLLFPIYSLGLWFHVRRNSSLSSEKQIPSPETVSQNVSQSPSSEEVTTRIIRSIVDQEPQIGDSVVSQTSQSNTDSFEQYLLEHPNPPPNTLNPQFNSIIENSKLSNNTPPIENPQPIHYELPPNCPSCKGPLDLHGYCNNCQKKVCPRCYNLNSSDTVTCACGYIFENTKDALLKFSESAIASSTNHPVPEVRRVQNALLGIEGFESERLKDNPTPETIAISLRICPYCNAMGWKENVCRCGYNYITKEYLPKKKE